MFDEDDLLPISALQHLLFCERQCALIHIEQAWAENRLTVEGKILHEKVHAGGTESRRDVRVSCGVALRSLRLGLSGKADVVEFHRSTAITVKAVSLPGVKGRWQPFPVEYKRGRPKVDRCDEVQLCAQALCLEEMLGVSVPAGALFYGAPRRRKDIGFDPDLRAQTEEAAGRLHALIRSGRTPPAVYEERCQRCSLIAICLPRCTGGRRGAVRDYLARQLVEKELE